MDTDNTDMVEGGEEDSVVDELNKRCCRNEGGASRYGRDVWRRRGRPARTSSSASKEMDSNGSTTEETEVANGNSAAPTENGDPRSRSWEE
jgi:hypothetical protein